jgi:hypothetical protein
METFGPLGFMRPIPSPSAFSSYRRRFDHRATYGHPQSRDISKRFQDRGFMYARRAAKGDDVNEAAAPRLVQA